MSVCINNWYRVFIPTILRLDYRLVFLFLGQSDGDFYLLTIGKIVLAVSYPVDKTQNDLAMQIFFSS